MLYSELAQVFDKLESTSARLEMTDIMAEFFAQMDPKYLKDVIYLSQGKTHPDFVPGELGMADRLVLKAIAFTSGTSEAEVERLSIETGDPGTVAEKLISGKKQRTLFSEDLTVERVMKGLSSIETAEGRDSQDRKMKYLANMLHDSGPEEARYLCRIVTGRMRFGAGSMTILDALAIAFAEKEERPEIERAFNITCDLGEVAEILAEGGIQAIKQMNVKVGNPIKVMLAERLPSIDQIIERMGGKCAMEYKYDGIRVQAHITPDSVKLYSRRLEDLTSNFPDVAEMLRSKCVCGSAIIEGECVAVDGETGAMLPFQNVTHRRKKHGMEQAVKDYPVKLFMFDILYANDEDMTLYPYTERREKLKESFELNDMLTLTTMELIESAEEGEKFFNTAIASKCEGIMAKSVFQNSIYRAGSRGFLWIKYKKDYTSAMTDSFDLAVVGAFYGMGKRAGRYGALLMAAFDQETEKFYTTCKLGTGFDDAFLDGLPAMLDDRLSKNKPASVESNMVPDVWFDPSVVLEVIAAEISISPTHTAAFGLLDSDGGLGLRFPRFTGRVRTDKDAVQCTTVNEILEMYEIQGKSTEPVVDDE